MALPKALTIAGSDSGGGAGIQADLKTFQELGVFGMSAVTAVTAQNTEGVLAVYPLPADAVELQLAAIGADLGADSVKTGMLHDAQVIEAAARAIRRYRWRQVVVDPVLLAKDGSPLLRREALHALKTVLIPLAAIVTPNIPEAEALTGLSIRTEDDKREAARRICGMGARYALIKGGHDTDGEWSTDWLFDGASFLELKERRVPTRHTHGTGCTLAAAVAAELAKGRTVPDAVRTAKRFVHAAIEDTLGIGRGHGPVNHWAFRRRHAKGDGT